MSDPKTASILKRFWPKVARGNPDDCWIWTAGCNSNGYGLFNHKGPKLAHRVSWELTYGPLPENDGSYHGICVLHRCDTPLCVNPNHLFIGTHDDNMADMTAKGRRVVASGDNHYAAKLTTEKVREIRELYANGNVTKTTISRIYGVSLTTISNVIHRVIWN